MLVDKRIKYVEGAVFPDPNTLSWKMLKSLESESFFFLQNPTIFLAEFHSWNSFGIQWKALSGNSSKEKA